MPVGTSDSVGVAGARPERRRVVCARLTIGPFAPEAAARDVDDLWVDATYLVQVDPQFRPCLRQQVGQEDIATPDKFLEHRPSLSQRQGQSDTALPTVRGFDHGRERDSWCGGGSTRDRDQSPLRVACDRVLDLDHVGAPVGEDRARRRHEGELRDFEHAHTGHRLLHLPAPVLAAR
jgi:hypothetical protein